MDFGFEVQDEPGSIKSITDLIRLFGGRLASILISYREAAVGRRHVYLRVYHVDRRQLEELPDKLFSEFKILYILDYLEGIRAIY